MFKLSLDIVEGKGYSHAIIHKLIDQISCCYLLAIIQELSESTIKIKWGKQRPRNQMGSLFFGDKKTWFETLWIK